MSLTVNDKDLGLVTAYAYAVAGGYEGTEAEFEALLGNVATDLAEIENLTVTVSTLPAGSSATASYSNGVLSLGIPKGDKGDKGDTGATGATGATGNGIASITKTGTSGNVDTYTITYTNGNTTTFTVTNGAVTSVAGKTGAVTLDADDVAYDPTDTYSSGTVGEAVSDLKSAINNLGAVAIPYTFSNKYFKTDVATINPASPTTSQNFDCAVVECQAGDVFTITATGYSAASLPWAFIDAQNNVLSLSSAIAVSNSVVTAPSSAAKLIINNRKADTPDAVSYYGDSIIGSVDNIKVSLGANYLYSGVKVSSSAELANYNDFNSLPKNKVVTYWVDASSAANAPAGFKKGTVLTLSDKASTTTFATQLAISDGQMWCRTLFGSGSWSEWGDNKKYIATHYIYVSSTGNDSTGDGSQSNPYATIFKANSVISGNNFSNRFIIKVADGTYTDLQTKYAGDTSSGLKGILTKDYVEYEGNPMNPSACVIEWDGVTGFDSPPPYDTVYKYCPFHIAGINATVGMHTKIRGFKIVGKNLRYCMHVDTGGKGHYVDWEISDCIFDWGGCPDVSDASSHQNVACIGTGSSMFENGHLLRCVVDNGESGVTKGFENHDSVYSNDYSGTPAFYEGAKIKIEACNFNGADVIFRSLYSAAETQGYNRVFLEDCIGIGTFKHEEQGGASNSWRADIKCSGITTNSFSDALM